MGAARDGLRMRAIGRTGRTPFRTSASSSLFSSVVGNVGYIGASAFLLQHAAGRDPGMSEAAARRAQSGRLWFVAGYLAGVS